MHLKKSIPTPSPCSRSAAACFIIYCCLFLPLRRERKLVPLSNLLHSQDIQKMCANKQRADVPYSLHSLPVRPACWVGVENESNWRSGVDKIRGERQ